MLRGRAQWIWAVALSLRLLGTAQCADLQYMDDQSGYVELHCDCDKDWTRK